MHVCIFVLSTSWSFAVPVCTCAYNIYIYIYIYVYIFVLSVSWSFPSFHVYVYMCAYMYICAHSSLCAPSVLCAYMCKHELGIQCYLYPVHMYIGVHICTYVRTHLCVRLHFWCKHELGIQCYLVALNVIDQIGHNSQSPPSTTPLRLNFFRNSRHTTSLYVYMYVCMYLRVRFGNVD